MMFQKRVYLMVIFVFCSEIVFSQEQFLTKQISTSVLETDEFLGFDNQQNYYSIKNNVLSKSDNSSKFEYKNVSLGTISRVDFQNPLQIVVFYTDFNTVILLDNQLNETKKIDFNLLSETVNVDAVALSSQNKLWFFDAISSKIGLYNLSNNTFKWISTSLETPVNQYHANYTHFYWLTSENKLNAISIFGKIKSNYTFPTFEKVQLINDEIALYLNENQLYFYEITKNRNTKIIIAENFITNFFFADGILAIFTENKIINYSIKNY